jgi:hypothetical protein
MHKHHAKTTSHAYPFTGPVRFDRRADPRAHGGASYTQTCSCGATRRVNASAGYRELGAWEI